MQLGKVRKAYDVEPIEDVVSKQPEPIPQEVPLKQTDPADPVEIPAAR